MPQRVAILGSTGSIGSQALDAVDALNRDGFDFEVVALVAGTNRAKLAEQAKRWPRATAKLACDDGPGVLVEAAARQGVDIVVHAIVGAAGLPAAFAACEAGGRRLCLANKESLVVGGTLLTSLARRNGVEFVPIDSEHTAIFQAMACGRREEVRRVILTASGGPFRDAGEWPADRLANATVDEALNHPTWTMGGKITVDSATLFNKGFELIEAVHLYGLPPGGVAVVVHPQSIVHSMVEFVDGSTIAHLSPVDMRLPIAYALTHPRRGDGGSGTLDWSRAWSLEFGPPDEGRFAALRLCREAVERGGVVPAYLNAANETAVRAFLDGKLRFGQISQVVERAVAAAPDKTPTRLDDLLQADQAARQSVERASSV